MKKILIFIVLFYFLTLLGTSFFIHFNFYFSWLIYPLILILVGILGFFEKPGENCSLLSAFFGGLFLDVFSSTPIGLYILVSIFVVLLAKLIFKKHVQIFS